jgi:hypothetical protein
MKRIKKTDIVVLIDNLNCSCLFTFLALLKAAYCIVHCAICAISDALVHHLLESSLGSAMQLGLRPRNPSLIVRGLQSCKTRPGPPINADALTRQPVPPLVPVSNIAFLRSAWMEHPGREGKRTHCCAGVPDGPSGAGGVEGPEPSGGKWWVVACQPLDTPSPPSWTPRVYRGFLSLSNSKRSL